MFFFLLSAATFGLEKASCRVMEDVTFRVCVVLKSSHEDCPVKFKFNLNLSATGRSSHQSAVPLSCHPLLYFQQHRETTLPQQPTLLLKNAAGECARM